MCLPGSPAPFKERVQSPSIPRQLSWEPPGLAAFAKAPPTAAVSPSRPQSLYVCLPALLECPPFQTEPRESWCPAPQLPEELRRVVSVYQSTLDLLRQSQVHPEVAAQVLAYLFFFSGTLLFNQLLDKGEGGGRLRPRDGSRGCWALGGGQGVPGRRGPCWWGGGGGQRPME